MLKNQMQNKKGVSVMIGYILLVVFAVIMGAIIFAWLRTYVPAEALNCPDGTSIFVHEATFDNETSILNLSLKNNGRFDIAGYFIHASNSSDQEFPTIDISPYINESFSGTKFGNSVIFGQGENLFKTGDQKRNIFDIPSEIGEPYSIRIIPTIFQEVQGRNRFVSCSNAKVQGLVGEPFVCVPGCTGKVCGSDGCGGSCGTCNTGFFCDAAGQCVSTSCTPVSNPCGTRVCGTATNGTCGQVNCGTCTGLTSCNQTTGQCQSTIGNGICDPGEDCSEPACAGQQAQCQTNQICQGGICVLDTSGVSSCPGYCALLGYNSSRSGCTSSAGTCQSGGGVHQSGGDQWCTGGPQADTCCCKP